MVDQTKHATPTHSGDSPALDSSAGPVASSLNSSGTKYRTPQGFTAIKDGIKPRRPNQGTNPPTEQNANDTAAHKKRSRAPKPAWLRVQVPSGAGFNRVKTAVRDHSLSTVCEESHCPNIGECWNNGTATIMLMGSVCTRACRFCAVDTGNPKGWLDPLEPTQTAATVELMNLRYIVLTSVDRDDLDDGGAAHYAACIRAIKARNPHTAVEALTPDFDGVERAIATVVDSGLEVFAQNVETVERLTHPVRDPRAGYRKSLAVLAYAKQHKPNILTKSSLMLGLGEADAEIVATMQDLLEAKVDILTLGQYLRPTENHLAVERWVTPQEFDRYRDIGLELGFMEVAAGPLVRSSYRADRILEQNNLGLDNQIPLRTL